MPTAKAALPAKGCPRAQTGHRHPKTCHQIGTVRFVGNGIALGATPARPTVQANGRPPMQQWQSPQTGPSPPASKPQEAPVSPESVRMSSEFKVRPHTCRSITLCLKSCHRICACDPIKALQCNALVAAVPTASCCGCSCAANPVVLLLQRLPPGVTDRAHLQMTA